MDAINRLKPVLEPESIAVIGAQPHSGEQSFNIIENLESYGYGGRVYPVNPRYGEVLGRRSYPTVLEIPDDVDLAIISTPRGVVPEIIRQCAYKAVKAAIVVGQGFADATDEAGKRLQQELVEISRRSNIRILGPNTVGAANAFANFSSAFTRQMDMCRIPVAIISQTGMLFGTFEGLKLLGKGIDLGNACDIDFSDALEYFEQDPQIKVIALHMEGVRDIERFKRVIRRVAMRKPVLVLKAGINEQAARMAQTHTASLIGRDEVWEAFFKQCGVIRVSDIDEMGDLVRAFCYLPPMRGRSLGIVSVSGGFGIMGMDACAKYGLNVAQLSPPTMLELEDMAPPWLGVGNPLDIWPIMMTSSQPLGQAFRTVLIKVLSDHRVNAVILIAGVWFDRVSPAVTEVIMEMVDSFPDKPIVWCPYEGWLYRIRIDELADKLQKVGKSTVFSSPDRAVKALAKLSWYYEFQRDDPC